MNTKFNMKKVSIDVNMMMYLLMFTIDCRKQSHRLLQVRDYFDRVEREYRHEQRDNYPHLNTAHQHRFEDESMMLLDDIKNTRIINDRDRFVIDIDAHRYRPDQIQVNEYDWYLLSRLAELIDYN